MLSCLTRSLRVLATTPWQEATPISEMLTILNLDCHGDAAVVGNTSRAAFRPTPPMLALIILQTWQILPMFLHHRALMTIFHRVNIIILVVLLLLNQLLLLLELLLLLLVGTVGVDLLLDVNVDFRGSSLLFSRLNDQLVIVRRACRIDLTAVHITDHASA